MPNKDGTPETPAAAPISQEDQDMADGHRYQSQEFRDARGGDKPDGERKRPARDAKGPKRGGKDGKDAKPPVKTERIAKVLARAGLASRREVERLIGLGKIAVNGRILETPAVLVSSTDVITVEGQPIGKAEPTRLWRYHKPVGLMTTHSDPQGRPTVFEKLPQPMPRVISVGRLDLNSEGLLLLTNDGELARALEMPSTAWVRQYRARALGHTTQAELDRLKNGTTVDGVIYGPMEATLDKRQDKADGRANVWLTVSITEGKNREVRKVLESIGLKVNRLIRLAYGPFLLGNLEAGDVEEVGPRVIRELLSDKIDPRNLPPEGASQTRDLPRARPAAEGRRAGGDRFGKTDARETSRPARERKVGDGPRVRRDFEDRREFKDRDFDERPRFEGDGESRDRRQERTFAPRGERSFDKKPWTPRPETGSEDRAPRAYKPREERGGGDRPSFRPREDRAPRDGARPARSYGAKKSYDGIPAGEAGAYERAKREFGGGDRPQGERSFRPREDRDGGGERKSYGNKPRFDRTQGERPQGERSFRPREDRGSGDRPPYGKPRFDRPQGDRPQGERSFRPREDRSGGDRPSYGKPRFDRPQGDRPQGERSFRPREDRAGGGANSGERMSYGDKPRFDRPQGDRSQGERSFRPREDRAGGGERKSYGDRPSSGPRPGGKPGGFGGKPGGFKPGGRPGGRPGSAPGGFSRKPRRED